MKIILTIDLDHNFYSRPTEGQSKIDWSCVLPGIKTLKNVRMRIEDKFNISIPVTWFVRCDNQVIDSFGELDYWFHQLENILTDKLDEFALHPHLVIKENENWKLQTNQNEANKQLEQILEKIKNRNIQTIRFGDLYRPQNCDELLKKYKIKFDSSILPGRKDENNIWDYSEFDNRAFSKNDLTHFPMSTFLCRTDYDQIERPLRYLNIAFKEKYFFQMVDDILSIRPDYPIVLICHPHELLKSEHKHQLIAENGEDAIEKNLIHLIESMPTEFFTFKNCPK
ncbi:MAG: hypothetical protein H6622_12875 [Halobacteriovoraceae bacterium]|nr:hypothetical protein [Halobacteriovoraceae bacterium]